MWTQRRLYISFVLAGCALCLFILAHRDPSLQLLSHPPTSSYASSQSHLNATDAPPPQTPPKSPTPTLPITPSTLLLRPYGFTTWDRLYVKRGVIYAVTEDPSSFPELKHIIAKGLSGDLGVPVDPTDKEMRIITPTQAKSILGDTALLIDGMSFILYDSTQFMTHYYHWWGEIILGAMRVYAGLSLLPNISLPIPEPRRFILPNVDDHSWRDYSSLNGPLMRTAFPAASIERADYWEDLAEWEGTTWVFERAMIVSREAAHKHPLASKWFKMISSTMPVPAPKYFFEPLRQRFILNQLSYLPIIDGQSGGVVRGSAPDLFESPGPSSASANTPPGGPTGKSPTNSKNSKKKITGTGTDSEPPHHLPLVLYISRQRSGRQLTPSAHTALLSTLTQLCRSEDRKGRRLCRFLEVRMEEWGVREQMGVVGRTTIMLGVHGNGLTHQMWMPASPRSTVIEIFYPKTYIHDYEILSRNMGHKHYAIWNDTSLTYEEGEWFEGVEHGVRENFHGNNIPVHAPTVAEVVRKRLTERIEG